VVVYRNVAVLTRPGADARKPEVTEVAKAVEALGLSINRIHGPGTLDGGDVLKVGDTVYVGRGGRTNGEGIAQLRSILQPLGAEVVAVPTTKVLHLKSAVTALPDGTVIGYEPLVDDQRIFGRFLPVPEESGAHVVTVGGPRLLMADDCPETVALLSGLGYEPIPTPISELQKLEGCVTCLSVRVRAVPAQRI
jgi:dimethylargininase